MQIQIREATRRAISILTAIEDGNDVVYSREFMYELLGGDMNNAVETVIALGSIACGVFDMTFENNKVYLQQLGRTVDELPEFINFTSNKSN